MCFSRKTIDSIWIVLISLLVSLGAKGQDVVDNSNATEAALVRGVVDANERTVVPGTIDLEIRASSINEQIVSHILKITNRSEQPFNGFIQVDLPSGIRALSREEPEISVAPGDSSFVAYRLVVNRDVGAGRKTIGYTLFNAIRERVLHQEAFIDIEQREQIYLQADDAPVMLINPEDSVRVTVTVNNRGNTREEVTLVFNVPNLRGAPAFTEVKTEMAPLEQRRFTHSFPASGNLLSSGQFSVYVTAMKGKEKTIFGNRTITVQNVFSNRNYVDIHPARSLYPGQGSADNSITLSYRQYNSSSNMMQLQGGGYINLPAGYLHLKGNLYKYSSSTTPMMTNTSLMYKLEENEFTMGNVSEQTELPLYGRGAKVMFSDDTKSKRLTFGAVDQNFNLVDSRPWFSDYYSFYVQGELGASNTRRGAKATYVYQRNPYEKAIYNVGSLHWRTLLGKNWEIQLEGHGALSSYENVPGNKLSGAAQFRYRGDLLSGLTLNGAGYYSDGYFPGSRKGTVSLTQGVSKRLHNDLYFSGSAGYNRTAPKSYMYAYSYQSENSYANATLSLPKWGRISSSLYYRHQGESSSSYSSYLDTEAAPGDVRMASHRLGVQGRWQSPNARHSFYGTVEGGFFSDPLGSGRPMQAKTTLNYSWQWFTANASYQKGAYYLYEYMMSRQQNREFYRFISSAAINKNISKKMSLTSSMNFTRDTYQGGVPSANLTANYFPKEEVAFFLNAYWYKYRFIHTSNIFNVQIGVTWNFSKAQPLSGRKSTVRARVYYDYNSNNQYDEGDKPADGYLLNLDEKAFISDENGKVRYSLVPYGEYTVRPMRAGRWFFDRKKVTVNSARTTIDIPLKQSGTLRGSIRYEAGEHSVDIVPRYEGLRFTIANADKTVTQTVITDGQGRFIAFLPVGDYTITLDKNTLVEHTDCEEYTRAFHVEAGKVNELEPFDIEVKSRRVNVKRFFSE
jgi:hypothetical protein